MKAKLGANIIRSPVPVLVSSCFPTVDEQLNNLLWAGSIIIRKLKEHFADKHSPSRMKFMNMSTNISWIRSSV